MNRLLKAAWIVLAIAMLASCKTNEKNYKAAYDTAINAKRNGADDFLDDEARNKMLHNGAAPRRMLVDSDTLVYYLTVLRPVESNDTVARFNIVSGSFKQIFNAREMASRLRAIGYPGATVVKSTGENYLVISSRTEDPAQALIDLGKVATDADIKLKQPFPYVATPPGRYR